LFIIKQQVQPSLTMQERQSQQAWIISQHLVSPLVQVTQQPSLVISHLHIPMVMLQQQTMAPLSMQQQLHRPPASIVHRFCIMLAAILSSQEQWIFMPPVHFSNLKVQRGTISQLTAGMVAEPGMGDAIPGVPIIGMPIPVRSIIVALAMIELPSGAGAAPPARS
jgi:hypothetical protein